MRLPRSVCARRTLRGTAAFARASIAAASAVRARERNVLAAPFRIEAALTLPPFAAGARACRCGLCGFTLQSDRAAARLEHLQETLCEYSRLRILAEAADVFQVIEGRKDVRALPRGEGHTPFVSANRMIGLNSEG